MVGSISSSASQASCMALTKVASENAQVSKTSKTAIHLRFPLWLNNLPQALFVPKSGTRPFPDRNWLARRRAL